MTDSVTFKAFAFMLRTLVGRAIPRATRRLLLEPRPRALAVRTAVLRLA